MTTSEEFAAFWAVYPRHVAKLAAMKAYQQARRQTSAETIQAGLEQYLQHLPAEVQFIPHAASWLRAGRWLDEYDVAVPQHKIYWWDECTDLHGGACENQWNHVMKKRDAS